MRTLYFLFPILMLFGCKKSNEINPKKIELPSGGTEVVAASNAFGVDIFQKILQNSGEEENFMFSPLSLHMAMCMALNGAVGATADQMRQTMHLTELSIQQIDDCYKVLISELVGIDRKVTFSIANSLWYDRNMAVKNEFEDNLKNSFYAEVKSLDFSSKSAVNTINNWCKNKTNGKIDKIIEDIPANEIMALINAMYFNGKWNKKFDDKNTINQDFHLSNGSTVQVPTMQQTENFKYLATDKFVSVELPYGQGNFVIDLFLPYDSVSIAELVESLKGFDTIAENYNYSKIELYLPRFECTSNYNLKNLLQSIGMNLPFEDNADFSNISNENLKITRILQKSYIKLDEEGTEAAVITYIGIGLTSEPPETPIIVRFDKPFVYLIREVSTNSIIFIGKIGKP